MSEHSEVIITAAKIDWLVEFTRGLVRDGLAACGQHITPIRSIYAWDGAIQDDTEARVALHTRTDLVPAIIKRANREHSYDAPCVIALPIVDGDPAYLAWIDSVTRSLPASPAS